MALLQRTLASTETGPGQAAATPSSTPTTRTSTSATSVFYRDLAPLLQLYRLKVGDILTITAFTRSGYVQSREREGLRHLPVPAGWRSRRSPGNINLMDLMSASASCTATSRADRKAEIEAIKKERRRAGDRPRAAPRTSSSAQPAATIVAEATPGIIDEKERFKGTGAALRREELVRRVYTQAEIEQRRGAQRGDHPQGPASSSRRPWPSIRALSDREHLGLRVVSWQEAAGILGQFVLLATVVLLLAVVDHLHRGDGHHQQRGDDGHPPARRARWARCGPSAPSAASSWAWCWWRRWCWGCVFGGAGRRARLWRHRAAALAGHPRAATTTLYFFFSGPRLFPTLSPWQHRGGASSSCSW